MGTVGINKYNVGRIAERIVSNELEYRGFRVSDLNKEGTSASADLLAAKDGKTWQIQEKQDRKSRTDENDPEEFCSLVEINPTPAFNQFTAKRGA